MKVVFLDIDGVLNNAALFETGCCESIGEDFLDRLQRIVTQTRARIVLSSSWRLNERSKDIVESALATRSLKLFDSTIELKKKLSQWFPRGEEIQEWLNRHPEVQKFAVLDDNDDAGNGVEHSFFQTSFQHGLTEEIAVKVIQHLEE